MVLEALRHWFEHQTTHESPEVERELLEAQRRDAYALVERLDAAEKKIAEKRAHDHA